MCTRNWTAALVLPLAFASSATLADDAFGSPASDDDIERVFLTVMPDGENLPEGSGTAEEGEALFVTHCSACHGTEGEGGLANQLVGGRGSLASAEPVRTVGSYWPFASTIFNYTRRAMPYQAPMSLTNDEYYAITAFILNRNDIIASDTVIDASSLPGIEMPNNGGFINAYPQVPAEYDYRD